MTPEHRSAFSLKIPRDYRADEIIAFHARDPEGLAEQVSTGCIRKGLVIEELPVALEIQLRPDRAACRICVDGAFSRTSRDALRGIARKMLGLHLDPQIFENRFRNDPLLGLLIHRHAGLRIPCTATPFEALMWAIIGQQINLRFAISLRRTFILLAGMRHSSGIWCHPDPGAVAALNPEELCRRKFSRSKADTLIRTAKLVHSGGLLLELPNDRSRLEEELMAIKGVGPWTVNYTLLRGFGFADCSLHGDVAVRTALQRLSGSAPRLDSIEAATLLEGYKPHRSLVAAHLWASLKVNA
jgi:DNA-3-methyladenine glycosylase II